MAEKGKAVQIKHMPVAESKHTMKAAQLLYSAPGFVLRGPIYIIMMIVVTAFFYSFWGKKTERVTCAMKLKGEYTTIQSPAGGIVKDILVTDGTKVDLLNDLIKIQFRTKATMESEEESLEGKKKKLEKQKKFMAEEEQDQKILLKNHQENLRILRENKILLETKIKQDKKNFQELKKSARQKIKSIQLQLNQANREAERLKDRLGKGETTTAKKTESAQIKSIKIQIEQAKRSVEEAKKQVKVAEEKFKEDKDLFEKNLITKPEFTNSQLQMDNLRKSRADAQDRVNQLELSLQMEKDKLEMRGEDLQKAYADARDRVAQIQLSLAEAKEEPIRLERQAEKRMMEHNEEGLRLNSRIAEIKHKIESTRFRTKKEKEMMLDELETVEESLRDVGNLIPGVVYEEDFCRVQSTFSGTVTNVYVKPGQMISPGEPLVNIVKDSEPIYAEALVPNQAIGKLKLNQVVQIKYFAYPYQQFGIKSGRISYISTKSSDAPGQESMYKIKVALDEFTMKIGSRNEPLTLGLEGVAEIKTGEKRLIELILTPISKFFIKEE